MRGTAERLSISKRRKAKHKKGHVGDAFAWAPVVPRRGTMPGQGEGAMPKANQLTVRCENRPGTLAHVAKVMGDADVNILGFLLTTSVTKGYVKLIVDEVEKAKGALEDEGLSYAEQVVLHAKLAK